MQYIHYDSGFLYLKDEIWLKYKKIYHIYIMYIYIYICAIRYIFLTLTWICIIIVIIIICCVSNEIINTPKHVKECTKVTINQCFISIGCWCPKYIAFITLYILYGLYVMFSRLYIAPKLKRRVVYASTLPVTTAIPFNIICILPVEYWILFSCLLVKNNKSSLCN